jgi:hypothetical protein
MDSPTTASIILFLQKNSALTFQYRSIGFPLGRDNSNNDLVALVTKG